MFRVRFGACDALVMLFVLAAAVLLLWHPWQSRAAGEVLVVSTSDGSEEYALNEEQTLQISSNGIALSIEIKDRCVRVLHSDCQDGVCMSSGRISKTGESILCAPAKVSLRIKGGDSDVDFVAG